MSRAKIPDLTDDTLKNILIMAPLLDEMSQNKVFGLMCGLISGPRKAGLTEELDKKKESDKGKEVV